MTHYQQHTEPMDLNDALQRVKTDFSGSPDKYTLLREVEAFEDMVEEECWDIEQLKDPEFKTYYLSQRQNRRTRTVLNKILQHINHKPFAPLTIKRLHKRSHHFMKCAKIHVSGSIYSSRDESAVIVDQYIPDDYRFLKRLEAISVKSKIPISEWLITGHHRSGLSIPDYMAQNELFNELRDLRTSPYIIRTMENYLIEYNRLIAKPLPMDTNQPLNINKFKDDVAIITNYMIEINNAIHKFLCTDNASYPIQLDVFFVAPDAHKPLNLHALGGLNGCIRSDSDGVIDGVTTAYRLLREAAADIKKAFGQRFIMLIVRGNKDDSCDDTIYIFKPRENNCIPDADIISNSVELTYLLNSKAPIVAGLRANDEGVLGFTHHLHSTECNKVYLSYGDYKSRVSKQDILSKLPVLFDEHNAQRHVMDKNIEIEFNQNYTELKDRLYHENGEYWFNNDRSYECYAPSWNTRNCRAMGNIYIPQECTEDLKEYISESFESTAKLYYNMDYTVAMQIVDRQTMYFKFANGTGIGVIHSELHRKSDGKPLYAIMERNTMEKRQKWKIIAYDDISQAFMTKEELISQYGIFEMDVPKGSKALHRNFEQQRGKIQVNEDLILRTRWSNVRVVQSKQNVDKMYETESKDNGVLEITEDEFKQLVIESLKTQRLTPMAHIKFRRNQYYLEELLPVYIKEYGKWIAISFCFKERGHRTEASGVCLDLTDMKNKANLVEMAPCDSWLNNTDPSITVNNLTITPNKEDQTTHKSSKKTKKSKKTSRSKARMNRSTSFLNTANQQQMIPPTMNYNMAVPLTMPQYSVPNYVDVVEQIVQCHTSFFQSLPVPSNFTVLPSNPPYYPSFHS